MLNSLQSSVTHMEIAAIALKAEKTALAFNTPKALNEHILFYGGSLATAIAVQKNRSVEGKMSPFFRLLALLDP